MNAAKIVRLCNEIEDAVNELAACCEIIDLHTHKMMIDKLRGIGAEVSAKPETNGDFLRALTDEQLAEYLNCKACGLFLEPFCGDTTNCGNKKLEWLRQEVSENDD